MLREYLTENYACLHRRLLRLFGCPDLASDCLHDAWLRLGKMADDGSVQSLEAYVYRTALNVAMSRLRGERRSQYFKELECEFEHLIDEAPSPDRAVEARCIVQAVERALQRLSCRHRSVLLALRLEERTRQEVADSHRISLRRVDTVLRQALDYCAEESGQIVRVGVSTPRRRLPTLEHPSDSAESAVSGASTCRVAGHGDCVCNDAIPAGRSCVNSTSDQLRIKATSTSSSRTAHQRFP